MVDDQVLLDLMKKVSKLESENARLRSALFSVANPFHGEMGLTRQLANIAYAFYENDVVSIPRLDAIISEYGWAGSSKSAMHTELRLRVTIKRLRSQLKPYGIDVLAVRGLGYKITDEGRRILEEKFGDKISAAKFTKPVIECEGVS